MNNYEKSKKHHRKHISIPKYLNDWVNQLNIDLSKTSSLILEEYNVLAVSPNETRQLVIENEKKQLKFAESRLIEENIITFKKDWNIAIRRQITLPETTCRLVTEANLPISTLIQSNLLLGYFSDKTNESFSEFIPFVFRKPKEKNTKKTSIRLEEIQVQAIEKLFGNISLFANSIVMEIREGTRKSSGWRGEKPLIRLFHTGKVTKFPVLSMINYEYASEHLNLSRTLQNAIDDIIATIAEAFYEKDFFTLQFLVGDPDVFVDIENHLTPILHDLGVDGYHAKKNIHDIIWFVVNEFITKVMEVASLRDDSEKEKFKGIDILSYFINILYNWIGQDPASCDFNEETMVGKQTPDFIYTSLMNRYHKLSFKTNLTDKVEK